MTVGNEKYVTVITKVGVYQGIFWKSVGKL